MKNSIRLSLAILAITTLHFNDALAARSKAQQATLEGGTFIGTTIAATVAGGPVGFIIGAISGAFLANQTRNANDAEISLAEASQNLSTLSLTVEEQNQQITQLEADAIDKLTFQVMFATGDDTLNDIDLRRVKILAYYLQQNPSLTITLEGHTDPQGTDEYNNVLSVERANAIKTALIDEGVTEQRIISKGHGNQFSTATKGDYDAYAKERRVDINISTSEINEFAKF